MWWGGSVHRWETRESDDCTLSRGFGKVGGPHSHRNKNLAWTGHRFKAPLRINPGTWTRRGARARPRRREAGFGVGVRTEFTSEREERVQNPRIKRNRDRLALPESLQTRSARGSWGSGRRGRRGRTRQCLRLCSTCQSLDFLKSFKAMGT